jgi:[ribosomal protein S18]-alanine N-acetyltransferase
MQNTTSGDTLSARGQQFFPRLLRGEGQEPEAPSYNDGVDFTLRDFRREDFEILWSIDQKCFPPGISYSRLELAAYIRRRGSFTLVAESSDLRGNGIPSPSGRNVKPSSNTLGFIVAEASRRAEGHILTIDVVPAARRLGVGSKLLTAAEDRLRAAKCHGVILETAVDNQAALAFYKRHGYCLVKTIPRYYSSGVDAFVLHRELFLQAQPS